jgi:hypothetical protein
VGIGNVLGIEVRVQERPRQMPPSLQSEPSTLSYQRVSKRDRLECERTPQALNEGRLVKEQLEGMRRFGKLEPGGDTRNIYRGVHSVEVYKSMEVVVV